MSLGGAEQRDGSIGQQPVPDETIRMIDWQQQSRRGVFSAGGPAIAYGNGPARLVYVSFSSRGEGGLQVETQRVLTTPRRA